MEHDNKEFREKLANYIYYNQKDPKFYKDLIRKCTTYYITYKNNEIQMIDMYTFNEQEKEYLSKINKV